MCDSLRQTPDNVSLRVLCRGTEEMEVICLHPMFLEEYRRPECFSVSRNHLTNRGMLLSPLVLFFCFSPHVVSSVCVALPALSAGAGLDGHVGVNLQHWVPGFVVVEHGQGAHLLWDAAGLGDPRDDPDGSDYALDGGVVGRPCHLGENQHKSEMKNTLYSV